MRVQTLSIAIFVRAAANVVGVVEQVRNAGYCGDKIKKFACLQIQIEFAECRGNFAHVHAHGLAAYLSHLVEGIAILKAWKVIENAPAECRRETVVNDHVTKRLRVAKRVGQRVSLRENFWADKIHWQAHADDRGIIL
ncbi:MAG TPA: hypothetical protein VIE67_12325 [Rudaea sp.]|uniref:hypothetical protein n=1 Tax=Rudaea sp. TaxID=2136325 RepID=UPI002F93CA05